MNLKFPILLIPFVVSLLLCSCSKTIDNTGTCSDGIKNNGEQGIDCGGPCQAPCPSCADGILNQDETGVDCGGQCDPCYKRLSAKVEGMEWNSTSRSATFLAPGAIRIFGTGFMQNITLIYTGPFEEGQTTVGENFSATYTDTLGNVFSSLPGGSITFSTFDTTHRQISGIFNFRASDTVNETEMQIDHGVFTILNY